MKNASFRGKYMYMPLGFTSRSLLIKNSNSSGTKLYRIADDTPTKLAWYMIPESFNGIRADIKEMHRNALWRSSSQKQKTKQTISTCLLTPQCRNCNKMYLLNTRSLAGVVLGHRTNVTVTRYVYNRHDNNLNVYNTNVGLGEKEAKYTCVDPFPWKCLYADRCYDRLWTLMFCKFLQCGNLIPELKNMTGVTKAIKQGCSHWSSEYTYQIRTYTLYRSKVAGKLRTDA